MNPPSRSKRLSPEAHPGDHPMSRRHLLSQLYRRHWPSLAATIALALLTAAAGAGLLGVAGWFLTGAALAGATSASAAHAFNLFVPSALVRGFSFIRIGARYAERLAGHTATLHLLAEMRRHTLPILGPPVAAPARTLSRRRPGSTPDIGRRRARYTIPVSDGPAADRPDGGAGHDGMPGLATAGRRLDRRHGLSDRLPAGSRHPAVPGQGAGPDGARQRGSIASCGTGSRRRPCGRPRPVALRVRPPAFRRRQQPGIPCPSHPGRPERHRPERDPRSHRRRPAGHPVDRSGGRRTRPVAPPPAGRAAAGRAGPVRDHRPRRTRRDPDGLDTCGADPYRGHHGRGIRSARPAKARQTAADRHTASPGRTLCLPGGSGQSDPGRHRS